MFVNNQNIQTPGLYPSFENNLPNSSPDGLVHQNYCENNNLVPMCDVQTNFINMPSELNTGPNTDFVNGQNVTFIQDFISESFKSQPYMHRQVIFKKNVKSNLKILTLLHLANRCTANRESISR